MKRIKAIFFSFFYFFFLEKILKIICFYFSLNNVYNFILFSFYHFFFGFLFAQIFIFHLITIKNEIIFFLIKQRIKNFIHLYNATLRINVTLIFIKF